MSLFSQYDDHERNYKLVNVFSTHFESGYLTSYNILMTGTQHFSPGDIQFQLVYDRGNVPKVKVEKDHGKSYIKADLSWFAIFRRNRLLIIFVVCHLSIARLRNHTLKAMTTKFSID